MITNLDDFVGKWIRMWTHEYKGGECTYVVLRSYNAIGIVVGHSTTSSEFYPWVQLPNGIVCCENDQEEG